MKRLVLSFIAVVTACILPAKELSSAAEPSESLLSGKWEAYWICDGQLSADDYGVYRFRKHFPLSEVPDRFIINISADNRYRLFVNGMEVCIGPARGDLNCWYYETVDISSHLQIGDNVLAVEVWNMGEYSPVAQISYRTGLIVQGNSPVENCVNTDDSWIVMRDGSFSPKLDRPDMVFLGCQDRIDGTAYPWGWEKPGFDDTGWNNAEELTPGKTYGSDDYGEYSWVLTPRDIPMMEETVQRLGTVRRQSGLSGLPGFISGDAPLEIPAGTKCSVLLDQGFLTTAYPVLKVSGGRGSVIRVTYAEAMSDENGKGNRNEIDGRICWGYVDEFLPDGAAPRIFRPLWFRTYRYVQLDIETGTSPLVIDDFYGIYTGYPFEKRGSFCSDNPDVNAIWDVGWRTARLCAHETYFDCPYYEQLQYAGDTRIQSLISLYVSGDDRLMRKAIRMFDISRTYEGITCSRYPSSVPQYIPQFSLYWVGIVHDFWMHRNDDDFVRGCLPGIRTVLSWFVERIDPHTGMVKSCLPHWNFTDWVDRWERGVAPESETSGSAITSLLLSIALDYAAELMEYYNYKGEAEEYARISDEMKNSVYGQCWNESEGMLMDYAGGKTSSQHVNIMGILSDAIPAERQQSVFKRLCSDESLARTTLYYKFYLFRAMKKAGLADCYTDMLGPWQEMIDIGLTTFAETQEPTRSDCHAWSASPDYDLLATVCGVEPASHGFETVRVAPHPGSLRRIKGVVAHPEGNITVALEHNGDNISGEVVLPAGVTGYFVWNGMTSDLFPGKNIIDL